MSKFKTIIPTEVQEVLDALPKNTTLHHFDFEPESRTLSLEWENDIFDTGLTVPVDFPKDNLTKKRMPKGVSKKGSRRPVEPSPEPTQAEPDRPSEAVNLPVYLSEQELAQCVTDKQPVEFMGINPVWQDFKPNQDVFTEGYFYRKKALDRIAETSEKQN